MGRSLHSLYLTTSTTLDLRDNQSFPTRIIYPTDFFPHSNARQQAMVEEFISVLETFLGIKRTEVSIVEAWNEAPPKEAEGRSIKDYLARVSLNCYAELYGRLIASECVLAHVP